MCSAVALHTQAAAIETEKQSFIASHGWKRAYKVRWRRDIDDGLREWPVFSHDLAKAMTFNPGGIESNRVNELVGEYVEDHLLSMSGAQDISIDFYSVVEDVMSTIPFIDEQIKRMKREFLNYLLKEAIGWTLGEIKEYLKHPEQYFNIVMGQGEGQSTDLDSFNHKNLHITDRGFEPNFNGIGQPETFDYERFPTAYNTVIMTKLLFMKPSEVNRLLCDLGSPVKLNTSNSMLGFNKSLDESNQWIINQEKLVFAKDSRIYRQIFMQQTGEQIGEIFPENIIYVDTASRSTEISFQTVGKAHASTCGNTQIRIRAGSYGDETLPLRLFKPATLIAEGGNVIIGTGGTGSVQFEHQR